MLIFRAIIPFFHNILVNCLTIYFIYSHYFFIRCLINPGHFFSLDPKCEGEQTESMLGYISKVKTADMPRALYLNFVFTAVTIAAAITIAAAVIVSSYIAGTVSLLYSFI